MKQLNALGIGLLILLFPVATALAAVSAQDPDISVNPVVHLFPVTMLGKSSNPVLFTINNHSAATLSLGSIDLGGVNADEFSLGVSDCGASLPAVDSCTMAVVFTPVSKGTKSATLVIPYGSGKTLTAFLSNGTSAINDAQRRVPAVLAAATLPETMTPGITYPLSWTVEGYDAAYSSYAVLFDCTGIVDGSCGNDYSDPARFAESTPVTQTGSTPGNWTYSGVRTKQFTFTWNFTVPATRAGGGAWPALPGTDIVVRIYQKSDIDASRNSGSVSLLIPGSQTARYYDNTGRRIVKKIVGP